MIPEQTPNWSMPELEIAHAYKDFYNGKYGKIDYEQQKAGK